MSKMIFGGLLVMRTCNTDGEAGHRVDEYPCKTAADKLSYAAKDTGHLLIQQDLPMSRMLAVYAPGQWACVKVIHPPLKGEGDELSDKPGD